jgi:hypothetical protein
VSAPASLMKAPTAVEVAALLAESDRRDRELAARLAMWRMAYRAAAALLDTVFNAGQAQARAEMERDWHAIADPASRNSTSHAELEARRWGPGGRQAFGTPRPGDFPSRAVTGRAA